MVAHPFGSRSSEVNAASRSYLFPPSQERFETPSSLALFSRLLTVCDEICRRTAGCFDLPSRFDYCIWRLPRLCPRSLILPTKLTGDRKARSTDLAPRSSGPAQIPIRARKYPRGAPATRDAVSRCRRCECKVHGDAMFRRGYDAPRDKQIDRSWISAGVAMRSLSGLLCLLWQPCWVAKAWPRARPRLERGARPVLSRSVPPA